ncbi:MAG: helix-turn-helix transcriptional regulator [Coriobacteriales bacterium]|nr:helix-turn-helix transcriptional regulator [Coriobacteriales bacterium]
MSNTTSEAILNEQAASNDELKGTSNPQDAIEKPRITLQAILACIGKSLGIPWLPAVALLCRSYNAATFATLNDIAVMISFALCMLGASLCFLVMAQEGVSNRDRQKTAWHCLIASSAASLVFFGIGSVPSSVQTLLHITGTACSGLAAFCFAYLWQITTILFEGSGKAAFVVVPSAMTGFVIYLGFCISEIAILVITAACCLISVILYLIIKQTIPCDTIMTQGSNDLPHQGQRLFDQTKTLFYRRIFFSTLLISIALTAMTYRFFSAPYERLSLGVFLSGIIGAVLLLLLIVISRAVRHEYDSLYVYRLSMIIALPAFFPMDPGSQFSIIFAITFTLAYTIVFIGAVDGVILDVTLIVDKDNAKTCCIGLTGISLGIIAGIAAGYVSDILQVNLPQNLNVIGIATLGMTSLISIFIATSVLIDREVLRDLRFLSAGKLPISYTLYEKQPNESIPEQMSILTCCKELALEAGLTQRESEVLAILAKGNSLHKVEEELFISQGTAITHRNNIYRKLNIHSKQELLDRIDALMQAEQPTN